MPQQSSGDSQGQPNSRTSPSPGLTLWRKKLAYLQEQEAIATDASVKFQLQHQIEECKQKINELEGQTTQAIEVPIQPASQVNRRLTGAEIAELKKSILGAYPDEESLEMVLSTYLNLSYNILKKGNNYEVRVFNLIRDYFEARNETPDLVKALIQERPNDNSFKKFQERYR